MTSRPIPSRSIVRATRGYTLVEILVAATLALILMGAVVSVFSGVGQSINNARAALETFDRLRAAEALLRQDLAGVTVTMMPPRRPEAAEGYFEYIEGPVGAYVPRKPGDPPPKSQPIDTATGSQDTTVGDFDDFLLFTTRSSGRPFVGVCGPKVVESDVAEVAWFVRGHTLYRRVLLVAPGAFAPGTVPAGGYYGSFDIAARFDPSSSSMVANTLGDLTKRENRFAHEPQLFPFEAARRPLKTGEPNTKTTGWGLLGLPTVRECSHTNWLAGNMTPIYVAPPSQIDLWSQQPLAGIAGVDPTTNTLTAYDSQTRFADDIVLTNVIGFDVKAWDSTAGGYVDLGYNPTLATPTTFSGLGLTVSQLAFSADGPDVYRVYDTGSFHYEQEKTHGLDDSPGTTIKSPDQAVNGFDDLGTGIVDGATELKTSPPYPVPLRGIQVKLRVFEPDSRNVREVTIVQDFLPK